MINKVVNIDTINILVDIENYEDSSKEVLKKLENEKQTAILRSSCNPEYKHIVYINDMTFHLFSVGRIGYAYILQNSDYQIYVAQYRSKQKNFSPIQLRISSECLWADGISNAWGKIYNWLVETFGNIIGDKVCRLDLCCHVDNVDFITNCSQIYKGKFKEYNFNYKNSAINQISFGSRKSNNIYCRIYNKSLEIREKKQKLWFYDIWSSNGMNIENVWNIEFELKSEFLRSANITTVFDVVSRLKDLWSYCTTVWLLKVDRTNKRIERCPINSSWVELQSSYDEFYSKGLITRSKQVSNDAKTLIPIIVGYISSYAAKRKRKSLDETFSIMSVDIKNYLKFKNSTFEKIVTEKKSLLFSDDIKQK